MPRSRPRVRVPSRALFYSVEMLIDTAFPLFLYISKFEDRFYFMLKQYIIFIGSKKEEIIEEYPDDFPHPSCLIFGHTKEKKILHIVVGSDNSN